MKPALGLGLASLLAACGPTHADCGDATCFGDDGPCLGEVRSYETELSPSHFVAGDFDGDTAIDVLAVGAAPTGAVVAELHRGLGDGSFEAAVPSTATGCSAYPLDADLDGDGSDDLLYPDCTGGALVFWGGSAGEPASVALPVVLTTAAVTDADGDGNLDILAFGLDDLLAPAMTLVRGTGNRRFAAQPAVALASGSGPSGVRMGDLDGDGNADAVTWIAGVVDSVSVRYGDGAGSFGPASPAAAAITAGHIAVGDLNPGGADELVISAPNQQRLVVGSTVGSPSGMASVSPYRPAFSTIAKLGDATSPGALVVDGFEAEVRYYVVDVDGAPLELGRLPTPHSAQWVSAPDLDGDGASDLLVGHFARGAFSVWMSSEL